MHPSFSMRTLQASRFMRVMAVFAWLMLVAVSLPAAAARTGMDMSHGDMPATMNMGMHHSMPHATSVGGNREADCCGNPSHLACHCDAMCGNVLFPAVPALSGAHMPAGHYVSFSGIDAPTLDPIPPLRPPAV
jgi:hypothetical protein